MIQNNQSTEERLAQLEKTVQAIEERNMRVERDKAWETSITRTVAIIGLTYIIVVLFMHVAQIPDPFINAIVPSVGFWLSTLTVPWIKRWWIAKH